MIRIYDIITHNMFTRQAINKIFDSKNRNIDFYDFPGNIELKALLMQ